MRSVLASAFRSMCDSRTKRAAASRWETSSAREPVVLAFVYYQCPMLCTQVMNGISSALTVLPFTPGQEFDIVLVSFDPRDTPEAANAKKRAHLDHWAARDTSHGWHFLTGDEAAIRQVTSAAGFTYQWDEQTQQFAHVSGLLVATPDGTLSRYFYGVEFSPKDLRLALVDSGNGKVGSVIDELLLYCFQYDPSHGRYGAVFMNILRLGGVLTVESHRGFHCADAVARVAPRRGKARLSSYVPRDFTLS